MTVIPNSFNPEELQAMLDVAKPETPQYDPEDCSKEYIEARVEEIQNLMADMHAGPLLPKVVVIEILNHMIQWHTEIGLNRIQDGEADSGVAWMRDAGKLQAALGQMLEVTLGHDDVWTKS